MFLSSYFPGSHPVNCVSPYVALSLGSSVAVRLRGDAPMCPALRMYAGLLFHPPVAADCLVHQ